MDKKEDLNTLKETSKEIKDKKILYNETYRNKKKQEEIKEIKKVPIVKEECIKEMEVIKKHRLVRMVNDNGNRRISNDGTDNNSGRNDNDHPINNNVSETEYNNAINFYIATGIQAGRKIYSTADNFTQFIINTTNEWLLWMRIWKWLFLIKEVLNIINIIYKLLI